MITDTGYHGLKVPKKRNSLEQILPHRRHLISLSSFLPGQNAWGMAEFKQDQDGIPSQSILPESDILRAFIEIAEVAIRFHHSLRKFHFLWMPVNITVQTEIPVRGNLQLPVYAEKIRNIIKSSDTPSQNLGRIRTVLFSENKEKILAEATTIFKLQPIPS